MARSRALALLLLAGCTNASAPEVRCKLSPGQPFADAPGSRFDGVAMDARGTDVLAVWSETAGLFARRLEPNGMPAAPAVRIGERCRGGVDVAMRRDDGILVGCVRPDEDEETSSVMLYGLDSRLAVGSGERLGPAGRDGRGIDVEASGNGVVVLHMEGIVGSHTVKLNTLNEVQLSRPGHAASQPALFVDKDGSYATFTETDYDTPGKATTEVLVARIGQPARVVQRVHVDDPAPHLSRDEQGLVLTFRDLRDGEHRAELYAVRLGNDLAVHEAPVKVGRANTEGAPVLHMCQGQRLGVLPREYGGERYIALHALGPAFENLSQGHQFYANERDFVLAAATCVGRELLVLAGEQKTPADRGVQLMALRFGCD